MKLQYWLEELSNVINGAIGRVIDKSYDFDDAIERRKTLRSVKDEFVNHSTFIISKLIELNDEEVKQLPESIKKYVENLKQSAAVMEEINEEILAEKGFVSCCSCKETIDASARFCPKCGADQKIINNLEETDE